MQALVLQAETGDLTHRAALADSLSAINRLMLSSLDAGAIMQFALDEGVRALAVDAGTIEMRDEPYWVVSYQRGLFDVASGLRLGEAEAPVATSVEKNGVARTVVDVQAQPELNVGFVRTNALRSELAVPLLARASVVGCLFFYGKQPRTFDDAEVDFARKLGATVSLALENARLYEEQQHIAATLQEHFMHERPLVAGLELGLVSRSAHAPGLVGGDFSDVFVLDDGRVAILIGDIAGKGVEAAGLTETVRSTARAFASVDASPTFVLGETNALMLRHDPDGPHMPAPAIRRRSTSGRTSVDRLPCASVRPWAPSNEAMKPLTPCSHWTTTSCSTPTGSPRPDAQARCTGNGGSSRP